MQKGNILDALEYYARAVDADPQNHHYKVRLAFLLKDASFPKPNPKMKMMILNCLQSDGIDHQNLSKPWYSLLMCDPNFRAIQSFIKGIEYSPKKLQSNITDPYFLDGLKRLIIFDIRFETAMQNIAAKTGKDIPQFIDAYNAYCENTEYTSSKVPPPRSIYPVDDTIPVLSAPQNETSSSVKSQYEENPYPRWISTNIQNPPAANKGKAHDYLMAGCGTGFGLCATAMLYPDAKITAIDISRASLTYAKTKAQQFGLGNIEFYQADILDLKKLDKKFDIINCSGVLHHMEDPMAGWQSLVTKLKDDGKMSIGLYSERGRQDVVAAREVIKEQGFSDDHKGIYDGRHYIAALPEGHPAREILKRRDFYSTSNCRDLIFHVQEHRYTITKIIESLDTLGLRFDGFDLLNPAIGESYQKNYPDDRNMLNLGNWAQFEEKTPETFRNMYQFWCCIK